MSPQKLSGHKAGQIMPVYEIQNGNYRAYRVTVGINGELRQKYFSIKDDMTLKQQERLFYKAANLDKKWQKELEQNIQSRKALAIPVERKNSTPRVTEVKGILMLFVKRRNGIAPVFQVNIVEGKCQRAVLDCGHKEGWNRAVDAFCKLKNIGKSGKKELLNRIPDKSKWNDVREHYLALGWEIPKFEIKS